MGARFSATKYFGAVYAKRRRHLDMQTKLGQFLRPSFSENRVHLKQTYLIFINLRLPA